MFPDYETPGTDGMYPNKQTPYFSGLVTQVPKYGKKYYDEKCDGCDIYGPAVENSSNRQEHQKIIQIRT